jgi:heme exporter protein D
MILLIVLDLKGTGLGRAVAISCVMLGVIVIHSVLRYTYFRNLPSEIRKQRAARRSSG